MCCFVFVVWLIAFSKVDKICRLVWNAHLANGISLIAKWSFMFILMHLKVFMNLIKLKCIINHWRQGNVSVASFPSFRQLAMPRRVEIARFDVIVVQPWRLVQTIRWNMLNTFVIIYYTHICWIRSCSILFCSMDIDIIFGPHKFRLQASIDHQ